MDLSRISKPRYVDPIREARGLIRLHARRSCAGHISSESAMIASARHSNSLLLLFALYYQSRSIHHVAAGNYRKGKFVTSTPPTPIRRRRCGPPTEQLQPINNYRQSSRRCVIQLSQSIMTIQMDLQSTCPISKRPAADQSRGRDAQSASENV